MDNNEEHQSTEALVVINADEGGLPGSENSTESSNLSEYANELTMSDGDSTYGSDDEQTIRTEHTSDLESSVASDSDIDSDDQTLSESVTSLASNLNILGFPALSNKLTWMNRLPKAFSLSLQPIRLPPMHSHRNPVQSNLMRGLTSSTEFTPRLCQSVSSVAMHYERSYSRHTVLPDADSTPDEPHTVEDREERLRYSKQIEAAVLEAHDSAVQQDATEDSEEDARTEVEIVNEYDYNGNVNDAQEESLDEDTILDFLKSSEVDPEYKAIPSDLVKSITQLWKKHSDKCAVIDQNQENWREILVYGVGVDFIKQEINARLQEFPGFCVKFCEEEIKLQHQHMSLDKVSVREKRGAIAKPDWVDWKIATCEVLVTATATNKDGNQDPVHFAVTPAHMMLTEEQVDEAAEVEHYSRMSSLSENLPISFEATGDRQNNNEYEDNESTVRDRTRVTVEKNSTKRRYVATWDEGEQHKLVHLNHPALFAYRRWVPMETSSCPNREDECITKNLCLHLFLNDIALLHLSHTDARVLKMQLKRQERYPCEELLPIKTQKTLNMLNSTQHHVVVGEFEGVARPPPRIVEDGNEYCRCLFFTLTSEDAEGQPHSLTDGDCGMIVYIKGDDKCLPVGMFIGAFDFKKFGGNPDNSTDRRTRLYQAIILSQALRNIEVDYPHHLKELGLFKLPSNSATTRLGARSPTSQCD